RERVSVVAGGVGPAAHLGQEQLPLFVRQSAAVPIGSRVLPPVVEEALVVVLGLERLDLALDEVVQLAEVVDELLGEVEVHVTNTSRLRAVHARCDRHRWGAGYSQRSKGRVRRTIAPTTTRTRIDPMIAPTTPPRSNASLSPIPKIPVKMSHPTSAPTRPSRMVTTHDLHPRMCSKASFGITNRATPPATMPRMSAPTTVPPRLGRPSFPSGYPAPERRNRGRAACPA